MLTSVEPKGHLLVGYDPMVAHAKQKGHRLSKSTLSKLGSPAIGLGPKLVGYSGPFPVTTVELFDEWLAGRIRPARSSAAVSSHPAEAA